MPDDWFGEPSLVPDDRERAASKRLMDHEATREDYDIMVARADRTEATGIDVSGHRGWLQDHWQQSPNYSGAA